MNTNVLHTVKNKLCTGCGICEDVCPKGCITIDRIKGEYRPQVDANSCLGDKCGKCLKVCPGVGCSFKQMSALYFTCSGVKEDKYIGRYVGLHTGFSLDEDIRFHSASGGMVSQFLIYLLDKKIIDGAVVTGFSGDDHITPVSYIARTKDEVLNARSSKYCPVALNKVGNEIKELEGRYVIVGLPCHIQGFRKRAAIDRKFRERVVGYFAIYCSSNRTFNSQDFIFRHYGVEKSEIASFAYRDEGCLGSMIIRMDDTTPSAGKSPLVARHNSNCRGLKIPYSYYYGPLLRSFFKPHRCLTCIDHYGELADVCFGDIHIAPYDADKVGISSWITRTDYWEEAFCMAAKEGYIHMDDLSEKVLNDSQATMLYPKRRKAAAVMQMDKMCGRDVAVYDKPLDKPGVKDYIDEIVCHMQRFVGRHRSLWFLMDWLNKRK